MEEKRKSFSNAFPRNLLEEFKTGYITPETDVM